jgi:hypothetical protein
MNDLAQQVSIIEEQWLPSIVLFWSQNFGDTWLPSHDFGHHTRVWNYAKQFLIELSMRKIELSRQFIENMLMACYFHDLGLSLTLDERHGKASRTLFEEFCHIQKLSIDSFSEAAIAIEKHDDKNYINAAPPLSNPSVISILSLCDDLDAFGFIGIVRYTEIYYLRGITGIELPIKVLNNLDKRYTNFDGQCKDFPSIIAHHQAKYLITKSFFEGLISSYEDQNPESWQKEVISLYITEVMEERREIQDLIAKCVPLADKKTAVFFHQLIDEVTVSLDNPWINIMML